MRQLWSHKFLLFLCFFISLILYYNQVWLVVSSSNSKFWLYNILYIVVWKFNCLESIFLSLFIILSFQAKCWYVIFVPFIHHSDHSLRTQYFSILRCCHLVIGTFFYWPVLKLPKYGANLQACRFLFVSQLIWLIIQSILTGNARFYKCPVPYLRSDRSCGHTPAQGHKQF